MSRKQFPKAKVKSYKLSLPVVITMKATLKSRWWTPPTAKWNITKVFKEHETTDLCPLTLTPASLSLHRIYQVHYDIISTRECHHWITFTDVTEEKYLLLCTVRMDIISVIYDGQIISWYSHMVNAEVDKLKTYDPRGKWILLSLFSFF